jgi:hypothetical protein
MHKMVYGLALQPMTLLYPSSYDFLLLRKQSQYLNDIWAVR